MNSQIVFALIRKDFKLYFSNRFFAVVTLLGLVAYIIIYFLLPATVNESLELGLYMAEMPPALEEMLVDEDVWFYRAESVDALKQAVLDGDVPAGYAFPDDLLTQMQSGGKVTAQLYLSPDVPPEFKEIYEVVLYEFAFAIRGQSVDIETTEIMLGPDMAGEQIASRDRMLPMLAVFVLMIECLGLASLIAAEVEAGTLRALLVTPLTMSGLFVGKGIFGTLFAFAQATLLILLTGGLVHEPLLILVALLFGAALVTGVAFLIGSVGRDLMSVMGWGVLAMLLLAMPTFTILVPGLASNWIKLIPSYYLVDTVYRVINFDAAWGDVTQNLLMLLVYAAAFMALGVVVLKRKFQ
ncbi:MAG: ABC transporter permease [Chloroflexi bacterium]|nr:ABC transporter permease [Chloroflexota bacterium]